MIHLLIDWKKCIPDHHHPDIFAIDFEGFFRRGYRVLILDIDNTLMSYDEDLPGEKTKALLRRLREMDFEIVLLSNNHRERIEPFGEALGLPAVFRAKKPLRSGFNRSLARIGTERRKDEVLVVGDQLMTDVYGAKRSGLDVCLVRPLKPETEKWHTKCNRIIEKRILKRIKKKRPETFNRLDLGSR